MKKQDLVKEIMSKVESVKCDVVRVYGVAMGVGYDLDVNITLKQTRQEMYIPAHAVKQSWGSYGHLRPSNPPYKYTGSNDVYQSEVVEYWAKKYGLEEMLNRFKMDELKDLIDYIQ